MNKESVGLNIKLARTKKNLTQEQLAEMADISSSYISAIERGKQSVSLDYINRIAHALGMPVSELLVHDKNEEYGTQFEEWSTQEKGSGVFEGRYISRQRKMNKLNEMLSKCGEREFQIVFDEITLMMNKFEYLNEKGLK